MKRFKCVDYDYKCLDLETSELLCWQRVMEEKYCLIEFDFKTRFYKEGLYHREDGPAIIWYKDQNKKEITEIHFWLEGSQYSMPEWLNKISRENQIKYLFSLNKYR